MNPSVPSDPLSARLDEYLTRSNLSAVQRAFLSRALYALESLVQKSEATLGEALGANTHLEALQIAMRSHPYPEITATPDVVAEGQADDDPLADLYARGKALLQELLYEEGPPLTVDQVADRLHITRQAVNRRKLDGKLIAIRSGRSDLYPCWQLAEGGVLAGLEDALAALEEGMPPAMRLQFFLLPNPALDGKRPLDALREGDLRRVLRAARLFGVHGAP